MLGSARGIAEINNMTSIVSMGDTCMVAGLVVAATLTDFNREEAELQRHPVSMVCEGLVYILAS